jgi:hypothetical protein
MQISKKYLVLLALALALPLGGCLSASNGLDYSRPESPPPAPAAAPGGPTAMCTNGTQPPCK